MEMIKKVIKITAEKEKENWYFIIHLFKIYLNLNDKLDKLEKVQCQSAKAAVGQLLDNSVMKIIEFYISYFWFYKKFLL